FDAMAVRRLTVQTGPRGAPGSGRCALSLVAWHSMGGYDGAWRRSLRCKAGTMQSPPRLEGGGVTVPLRFPPPAPGDSTAVRLSAPGAVRHDVANQVAHVVLQISDDVLDDVSHRDHAHDLARVQHW